MFCDDELLPLSGLQHLVFCRRQYALIHIEGAWAENRLTAEGRVMHEKVHGDEAESRPGIRIARGLRIHSRRLGLAGQADVVEFHEAAGNEPGCVTLPGRPGRWRVFPIEYKRGKPKPDASDEVQLCAQALCLEEMLDAQIGAGALFYGRPRRRTEVVFDESLREETARLAAQMRELAASGRTPAAEYGKRCENCSLNDVCQPRTTGGHELSASAYLDRCMRAAVQKED